MKQLISTITLCKRAGRLLLGFDQVKEAIRAHKTALVLTAEDLSDRTRDSVTALCRAGNTESLPIPVTMDELWYAVGKRTGILAVTDQGFARLLKQHLSRATQNREEPNL